MKRREFLLSAGALLAGRGALAASSKKLNQGIIMTVAGAITPEMMGTTLSHEHVLVDFIGAEQASPNRYNANEAYKVILPHLLQIKGLGCQTFVECTPSYLGRDVKLLQRLSTASGLYIVTNTGYYGAGNDKYVPKHAFDESADQLAERWLKEWNSGIDGTSVKPGFIKTGVDSGSLSDIDAKLVTAAAKTCKQSGLPIASHTGDTRAGLQQIDILVKEGCSPASFIWVHAQNDWQLSERVKAAKMGAWISVDNVSPSNISDILTKVISIKSAGILNKLLISHDAGWYAVGEPNGGNFRPYDTLFTTLIPAMKNSGITQEEIDRILITNPRNAFTIGGSVSGL